ncbi:DUF5680 domain-containing protein [Paludibacterium yongneupense]|uniref:DUF5680 domain-containing protein n=1 Tax=Paludibacterium yongneupense TaxID=400061 RepID=UPI00040A2BC6|nr:DUF5680 domain-containing protein [Paludibacterium yongneupense]
MNAPHDLPAFLRRAKQASYAAGGDAATPAPLPDMQQLEFRDGDFSYRDVFAGSTHFAGQEIVYQSERAAWAMSYSGGLAHDVDAALALEVYAFLREALRRQPLDMPLRGPALFGQDGLRYDCRTTGTLECFHGTETIRQGMQTLYTLHFSGGCLA